MQRSTYRSRPLHGGRGLKRHDDLDHPIHRESPCLADDYLENDLEQALIRELEQFILELGKGFAFVERQKRMIIDGEDFYLDLLFYHRRLKRLVAVELKIDRFKAAHKGQMELYLN
jgi:predicted nuclease of restriction endonuclease-like (RecB) superfamily